VTSPEPADISAGSVRSALDLADWRRQVAALYAEVRELAQDDPRAAWEHWRAVRERLYREHPQSPVPSAERPAFRAGHWPYDPAHHFEVEVQAPDRPTGEATAAILPMSTGSELDFTRVGRVDIPFPAGARTLNLFWMSGYAGGLFLPFRDATNGRETYGAGRYLLDTAKGADLGGRAADGRLVLDFNFAFQPSCAVDPRWACPLAPPENRLDIAVKAGERIRSRRGTSA
jgi:uncharacterized protein (DUF1684 family)